MAARITLLSLGLLLTTSLAGCGPDAEEGTLSCLQERVALLGLDAPLPNGTTVRDQLANTLGQHSIEFNGSPESMVTPNSSGMLGSIEIIYQNGPIELVKQTVPPGPPEITGALNCETRVQVPVRVGMQSQDGAFQDSWDGQLHLSDIDHHGMLTSPTLDTKLPDPNQGSLVVNPPPHFDPATIEAREIGIHLTFFPTLVQGNIDAYWQTFPLPQPDGSTSANLEHFPMYSIRSAPGAR